VTGRRAPRRTRSALAAVACLLGSTGLAHAADPPAPPRTAKDALPGSPQPIGVGLAPDAPEGVPAPGGRAPSFGAPTDPDVWSFRWGGKMFGYISVGFNERVDDVQPGQSSLVLHTPPRISGREPFGPGAALTLNFAYGTPVVSAFVNYTVNSTGREREGWYQASKGAAANSAYIGVTPQAFGNLRLNIKVGAVSDSYGGTGQWGWGILGPLLATRGYGETIVAEYDLSPDWRLFLSHGLAGVPGVPEFFVRGVTTGWNETGVSSFVQHGHLGIAYQNRFQARVHVANAAGTDERQALAPGDYTTTPVPPSAPLACGNAAAARTVGAEVYCPAPRDGRMDVLALETHTYLNQWGHFGLSGAYYNLVTAVAVHDSIWWTIDWTQGARETINKYLGTEGSGTGKLAAITAQYDFSLASVLWHPQSFDGRGADLRASIAGLYHWTIDTDDSNPRAQDSDGYLLGLEVDYRMLPWMSATLRAYGTSRDSYVLISNVTDAGMPQAGSAQYPAYGVYRTYSLTPGLSFRSDWQAPETIEIAYSRRFYNDFVDANPAAPLDQDIVTVGAQVSF